LPWGRAGLVVGMRFSVAAAGQPRRGSAEPEPPLLLLCSVEKMKEGVRN
jgi:hypothetical protein